MAPKACSLTFQDHSGIKHTVEVMADSLYEGAVLGLHAFKVAGCTDGIGPATVLTIEVKEPVVRHSLTVGQVQRWVNRGAKSPSELLKKGRLKRMLQ